MDLLYFGLFVLDLFYLGLGLWFCLGLLYLGPTILFTCFRVRVCLFKSVLYEEERG